jgi:recombination protein RecA
MATRRKKVEAAPVRAASPVRRATGNVSPTKKTVAPLSAADKAQAVIEAFSKAKKFKGVIRIMGDERVDKVDAISSGSIGLDKALGTGGFARGRIIEIYGPESGGKTTLALQVVANCQREGGTAVYVDAEHAMDEEYCRKLGVDVDTLMLMQPDYGEQGLEAVELAVLANADIVVVDSVAALTPKAEIEGDYGDSPMGLHARMMSQALRKLTAIVGKSKTCVIFINQIREKIGVTFGSNETTTGGRALRFYASQRVDIRRIGKADGGRDIGNKCRARVVKNKLAPPFREAEFDIIFGHGVDAVGELLGIATTMGLVEQSGAWYSYNDERLGMGAANSAAFLEEHPEVQQKLRAQVMAREFGGTSDGEKKTDDE